MLAHQLSSLVRFPPKELDVTMTVFHTPEDTGTKELLEVFETFRVPNVTWRWWPLEGPRLMRRAIGRNEAALATRADWIWFTDCDVVFHEGCLDGAAGVLEGRSDPLVHPEGEFRTRELLSDDHPLLTAWARTGGVVEIDPDDFVYFPLDRATGPMQITHGDAARSLGYCDALACYQKPAETWQKAREDRAFRWLLGTRGTSVPIPGVYRIGHSEKGRYREAGVLTRLRRGLRNRQARRRAARVHDDALSAPGS